MLIMGHFGVGGMEGVYESALCFLLNFSVNLKVL